MTIERISDLLKPGTAEKVCGWFEHVNAESESRTVFHAGEAGLSWQECKAIELATRFTNESGDPNFAEMARHMPFREGGELTVSRKTAANHLARAREKLFVYLRNQQVRESWT